ncbi:MAG: DUF4445 domain-containing protein [Oscillospiraceae bacterium]|nr:DUF4445 domain-containing protein [Oscillospiraceae bacterium]
MKVTFKPSNITVDVEAGSTIMQAALKAGVQIDAPCGGNGKCRKCKVTVIDVNGASSVLACQSEISDGMTVDVSGENEGHRILMGGITRDIAEGPAVKVVNVRLAKADTSDLRACWRRLVDGTSEALGIDPAAIKPNLKVCSDLYNVLEKNGYNVDVVVCGNEILDVLQPGAPVSGIAYDIGTTTIAAYFADLRTGAQLVQTSMLNPQVKYGGDVIMRMKYSIENGLEGPTGDIRAALRALCEKCASECGRDTESVYLITVVGNTCMHHLFMGILPSSLAYAPYTPQIADAVDIPASECGLDVNPSAKLHMLPNIAGFVGADTVGAALSSAIDEAEELTLLIDIGTNGEMVLGTKERLITCSTAAGPAFEGALITCGMRGAEGAVDHVSLEGGRLSYSVIGGGKPIGICGSGLIDLMAELVRTGLVETVGRLRTDDEIDSPEGISLKDHIIEQDGMRCFLIADEQGSGNGTKIVFTQKDIREVQLAKGAMAAGIQLMCSRLGVRDDDIKKVMIAGAFGSYMSPKSACQIGLIPPQLVDRVIAIGNAAGQGAKLCLLSDPEYERAKRIGVSCDYLELAADPLFQDVFVDQLEFPGDD